ncbi:MAG: PD40 domain-containing protein [Planctomycetales bacterium]|nr:PD40 domain-containing protein [Planctomycetales bacterium]
MRVRIERKNMLHDMTPSTNQAEKPRTATMAHRTLLFLLILALPVAACGQDASKSDDWDIESPPGPTRWQTIDASEGTWMNLDVSPDGKQIAFDLLGDIYLMPISGADGANGVYPRKVTSGMAWDMQPRFHPEGTHLAFTSDRRGKSGRSGDNLWIVDLEGKLFRQVTNETFRLVNGPAWRPDGQYLVARKHFTSRRSLGAGEMWLYHHDGIAHDASAGVPLTQRGNDQKDVNEPVFSPDSKYLYYSQDATGGDAFEYDKDSNKQIYVVKRLELATGKMENFITGPGGACRPTPSPDGRQLAFVRRVGANTGLHLLDIASGEIRLVYDELERDMQEAWAIHGVYPTYAWTPDGKSIVIWARGQIRRVDIETGEATTIPFRIKDRRKISAAVRFPVQVAPEEFDVRMLQSVRVSPDGKQVAYQALGHIYLRDLPTGRPRRLTRQTEHFEFYPSFSRDGKYVVYSTWNDDRLGSVRVASTSSAEAESWKVTADPGHYIHPVFSPSGETVVYERVGGGYLRSPLWSREPGLYRVPTRGGESRRILDHGSQPQFAAAEDRVFFLAGDREKDADNLQLRSVDLSGLEERTHYRSQWATDYQISPDGQWVAFVERFNVYLTALVQTGATVSVGPKGNGLPVFRLSEQAGDNVHFSGDSQRVHWSLGPELYTKQVAQASQVSSGALSAPPADQPATDGDAKDSDAADADAPRGKAGKRVEEAPPSILSIGFRQPHHRPEGVVALVGGRIVTMDGDRVIDDGVIVLHGNRIREMGPRGKVKIPPEAKVISIPGQVVLPGFVDVHAHGPQATAGMTPQRNWVDYARLAFGVTTIHDPSNDTRAIFAASELAKAGLIVAPRTFSTGTILYGAAGSFKAEIDSQEDAEFHLRRMQAVGAFSVKSYNQPRRDQRQQVLAAARKLKMMVVPEGGSLFMHNMTMVVDGHTGIEHTLPVQTAYDDVMDLWRGTGVGYTPTLSVAYGGISGEQYWYEIDDLWLHPRLQSFIPPHVLQPRARRRNKSPKEDYNHIRVAEIAKQLVDNGELVQAGGHGQLSGICTHWEMWSFVQGGMTPLEALRCGTLNGAKYLGLDGDLGSLAPGKLADLVVLERGADPTKEIRHSERIELVIANGRLFDARRMNELGQPSPRSPFYWEQPSHGGIGQSPPHIPGCGCHRPGLTTSAP